MTYELIDKVDGVEYYVGDGVFDGDANGKDDITGGSGADTILSGSGDDVVDGRAGNDTIGGGNGDDVLTGGAGNDVLTGGNGADTFSYGFTVTMSSGAEPQSYADYLASLGIGGAPTTQNEFSTTYSAWLEYLVFGGGDGWQGLADYFGWQGEITIGLNQNGSTGPNISVDGVQQDLDAIFGSAETFTWTKGKASQTRTYWDLDDGYDWGGETTVSTPDGKDSITDFKVADGDKLFFTLDVKDEFLGGDMTEVIQAFKDQFEVVTGDYNSDTKTDTRMVLDDDMSITLLGYSGGEDVWNHVTFSFV